jgi:hypothetical protein
MVKKAKIGRPRLPKGEAKQGRLYCRLSQPEAAEIEAAARAEKKSKSLWVRETLLSAARAKQ